MNIKKERLKTMGNSHLWDENEAKKNFIAGYKAKSEIMFSLEDIKRFGLFCGKFAMNEKEDKTIEELLDEFLTKPKEYEFVPEMENVKPFSIQNLIAGDGNKQPKIVNNKIQGYFKEIK